MDQVDLLGVAICDECSSRIRVLKKHQSLVGKAVRCPKCHTRFRLELLEPTSSDMVAIKSEQKNRRRSRRSKIEIREEHITTAMEGFKALHERLNAISEDPKSSEEQIRVWCLDALRTALGYSDDQLSTEMSVMGGRVDIAIQDDEGTRLVIECKNIRSKLRNSVRDQAGVYAATLSAPWAVITNGDIWKLYRVTPQRGKSPSMDLVFDLALLDEDGISKGDSEHLYLLSYRALSSGDTEREFHEVSCTSPAHLYQAIFSERVLNAIRVELKDSYRDEHDHRVKLSNEDVEDAIGELLTPLEFGQ